jgi:hypothetical protein
MTDPLVAGEDVVPKVHEEPVDSGRRQALLVFALLVTLVAVGGLVWVWAYPSDGVRLGPRGQVTGTTHRDGCATLDIALGRLTVKGGLDDALPAAWRGRSITGRLYLNRHRDPHDGRGRAEGVFTAADGTKVAVQVFKRDDVSDLACPVW